MTFTSSVCLYVVQAQVRFIVMGNLFCSEYYIHRRFDLKGSSHGRMTDKADVEIDEMTILKDLDLYYVFRLHRSWHLELIKYIFSSYRFNCFGLLSSAFTI